MTGCTFTTDGDCTEHDDGAPMICDRAAADLVERTGRTVRLLAGTAEVAHGSRAVYVMTTGHLILEPDDARRLALILWQQAESSEQVD